MEFEFDKEMDSLLRQSAKSDILFPKQNANTEHIDADEISMFAENALPKKAKPRVMKHLADCKRCRIILSNLILLNSEAKTNAVSATNAESETLVASSEPSWFQRLFSPRNFAFGMGAIALIFAVGIGFIVIQNISNGGQPSLAIVNPSQNEEISKNEVEFDDVNKSNESPNSNSSVVADDKLDAGDKKLDSINRDSKEIVDTSTNTADKLNNVKTEKKDVLRQTQEKPSTEDFANNKVKSPKKADVEIEVSESNSIEPVAEPRLDRVKEGKKEKPKDRPRNEAEIVTLDRSASKTKSPPPSPARKAKRKAKVKEKRENFNRGLSSKRAKIALKRKVNGKTFTRINNIWTDSLYKNQKTTNIKRNTPQYRKLDAGIQSIGNQLNGTVIVIWKSKAYKIQ